MEDLKEKLLKKITQCSDNITVGEVCEIFIHSVEGLEKETNSIQNIKSKVTSGEYNAFMNAILFTLFSAIYINCHISEEEQQKRAKEFYEVFRDNIKSVGITKEPKTYDA